MNATSKPNRWLPTLMALMVGIFTVVMLSYRLGEPPVFSFDEVHYVGAARLLDRVNKNWEHPPLGKYLILASIRLFGDNPIGWRIPSVIAATGTNLCLYGIAESLVGVAGGVVSGIFGITGFLLFVQGRTAMLDTYLAAWLALAFYLILKDRRPLAAVAFGLACATKWSALPPLLIWLAFMLVCGRGSLVGRIKEVGKLFTLSAFTYYIVFLPLTGLKGDPTIPCTILVCEPYSLWDLIRLQHEMYLGQLRVTQSHHYMSQWYQWPLLDRPIWFHYADYAGQEFPEKMKQGVLMIGNPLVMVTGLLAWLHGLLVYLKEREPKLVVLVLAYVATFLPWIVIPRAVSFYYYYYPSGLVLGLLLTWSLFRLAKTLRLWWIPWAFAVLSMILFVYFYPVLAAVPIRDGDFLKWMWRYPNWV